MKLKLQVALTMALLFISQLTFAQAKVVSGTVTASDTNEPLPGVSVVIEGTTTGTVTDLDGNYVIEVPNNDVVLLYSYIGMTTQSINVGGQTNIDIKLEAGVDLDEFVVTALGISREKKSLGYATQEVSTQEIVDSREANVVNSLQGRVAGVQVNSSGGGVGASSRVTIRGNASFTANNQPLWVIDGIPMDNSNFSSKVSLSEQSTDDDLEGIADFGNSISDINPDDIESMNVLKGAAATSLYGSRAQNGAIIITTKTGKGMVGGKKGLGVSFGTSYSWDTPLRLPEFQNKYGQGGYGAIGLDGSQDYVGVDESWGQEMDAGNTITDYLGRTDQALVSRPDNVKNFFETGSTFQNNLSIAGANEFGSLRLSWSGLNQKGIVPNTQIKKNTASLSGTYNLTSSFRVSGKVAYYRTDGNNRPGSGYDGQNVTQQLFNWFGRQVNLEELSSYKDENGNNILNPETGQMYNWNPVFHNNPYWTVNENTNTQTRNRVSTAMTVGWDLTDWLTWNNRGGVDSYSEERLQRYAAGSIDPGDMKDGGFFTDDYNVTNANYTTQLAGKWDLSSNFSLNASLGWDMFYRSVNWKYKRVAGLSVPGIYNVSNASGSVNSQEEYSEKAVNGLFATASLGFKRAFFLDMNVRNDWSSTLPADNNSYTYGAVSLSWVFSETFEKDWFGKFRINYASVGNDTDPYQLQTTFVKPLHDMGSQGTITYPVNDVPSFTLSNTRKNAELKPERTNSFETGVEFKFFNDRLGFDYAYYNATTKDQIVQVLTSGSVGYTGYVVNSGEIVNKGHELLLYGSPVRTDGGFEWIITANFTRNQNEVISIHPDVETLIVNDFFADVIIREGEEYGVIFGTAYKKDENGDVIVAADGRAERADEAQVIGYTQPDFILGLDNTLHYKSWSFSFLIDWKQGGDMFSVTNWFGGYSGVLSETEAGRDGTAENGIITEGVTEDGSPNTVVIDAETYWHNTFRSAESAVSDASWVKLRRVNLSFSFPESLLDKTPFGVLRLTAFANNAWLIHSNINHIDPESSTFGSDRIAGLETNALPSTKSFGLSLNLTF